MKTMKTAILLSTLMLATMANSDTTLVTPNLGGGYSIYTPGQPTTQVTPNLGGGYSIYTPGQSTTQVTPTLNGGFSIYTPGTIRVNPNPLPGSYK